MAVAVAVALVVAAEVRRPKGKLVFYKILSNIIKLQICYKCVTIFFMKK